MVENLTEPPIVTMNRASCFNFPYPLYRSNQLLASITEICMSITLNPKTWFFFDCMFPLST